MKSLTAAALMLVLAASPALAQETKTETPAAAEPATVATGTGTGGDKATDIVADSMEVLDQEKKAVFTGNVDMKRADVHWTADKMIVEYEELKNADGTSATDAKFIDSSGHVKIVTDKETITAEWAKMDVKENILTAGGKVKVVQGETILNGEKLVTDLDTDKTVMTGGRVRGQFKPK